MSENDNFGLTVEPEGQGHDPRERNAFVELRQFFESHQDEVFFSRQLEV